MVILARPKQKSSKTSVTLKDHGAYIIEIIDPNVLPYCPGSKRARAWQVISLMQGVTICDAHYILKKLEPNVQGKVGRPLGWVADAIDSGHAKLRAPSSRQGSD